MLVRHFSSDLKQAIVWYSRPSNARPNQSRSSRAPPQNDYIIQDATNRNWICHGTMLLDGFSSI